MKVQCAYHMLFSPLLLFITSSAVAKACTSGDLRLTRQRASFIGNGLLEICRGSGESGGGVLGVWQTVCLQEDENGNQSLVGLRNARVACRQLKSQNNWNFNISEADVFIQPRGFFTDSSYWYSYYASYIRPTCDGTEEQLNDCSPVQYDRGSCYFIGLFCYPSDRSILPACSGNDFQCQNELCIDLTDVCNGRSECGDESDETLQLCVEKRLEAERGVDRQAQQDLDISVGVSVGVPLIMAALWLVALAVCLLIPRCPLHRAYYSKPHPNSTGHTPTHDAADHEPIHPHHSEPL